MKIGDPMPSFDLPSTSGGNCSDSDLSGQWSVIYFYPKDNTPGCTKEALQFSEYAEDFKKLTARVVGVSKDSLRKHENFRAKHELTVELISDENGELCEAFGVWVEKQMYGKTYMGIQRSTFLFNPDGKLLFSWPKVKLATHAEDVLNELKQSIKG